MDIFISHPLTLTRQQNFKLPKIEAFADDRLNVTQNIKNVFHRIYLKRCRKRRKFLLPAFSSFPTMFSKDFPPSASKVVIVL